jgi:hypothetical protein
MVRLKKSQCRYKGEGYKNRLYKQKPIDNLIWYVN